MYIFPTIGLAVYATDARRVTGEMFLAAARAVAERVTASDLESGLIYPSQTAIFETAVHAGQRVAQVIFAQGLASVAEPADLAAFIRARIYEPEYPRLIEEN
jgi:malate dehydrogenase (oxaloacetate-decarboxylating)(NADP+)